MLGEMNNKREIKLKGVEQDITVDKSFIEKKLRTVKLNLDKEIDITLTDEAYTDVEKFEVIENADGTINIVIKNVKNCSEK